MSESMSAGDFGCPVSTISKQAVRWLWPGWVARGVLSLLDGDPGIGKSTLTVDLAAWISVCGFRPAATGGPPGKDGETPVPGECRTAVLILSAEDDPARVIRPRLEAAGANLERVFVLDGLPGQPERPLLLPDDVAVLREFIDQRQVALVIVDPLVAYLGRGVNAHSDQHVRRALFQLKQLVEATQCAMVIVRHLNKAGHLPVIYRGGGSIGILGACRIALAVGKDPADDTRRVLVMNKCNLADKPPSLRFHLERRGEAAVVVWDGECDWTADEVFGKVSEEEAEDRSRVNVCADYIRQLLKGKGKMLARDVELECKLAEFGEMTIRRARKKLRVQAVKLSWGPWELSLPAEEGGKPAKAEELKGSGQ